MRPARSCWRSRPARSLRASMTSRLGGVDRVLVGLGGVHSVADGLVGGVEGVDRFGLDLAAEGLEVAADGDGGDVGLVGGEGVLEDVASGREVGLVGDDGEVVGGAASGGADVEGAVAGAGGDEGVADVDGVALVAVGGGGVAEPQVLAGVVGRDGDGALSSFSGQGEVPVDVDMLDSPELAVADGFVVVGAQGAVVAAGDDDVAGPGGLPTGDRDGGSFVEVAEVAAGVLDGSVEGVDVGVGLGGDGDGLAVGVEMGPGVGDAVEVALVVVGVDALVVEVGVERPGSSGAEAEGGVGFPSVGEAVDVLEVVGAAGAAELVEHAASADGLELAGVADEDQSPLLGLGEADEPVEGVGANHSALVNHERGAGREPVGRPGAVGAVPLVEELGDGVGSDPGLRFEDTSGLRCRGDAVDGAPLVAEVETRGGERGGLAGPGRSDHEHDPFAAGDGAGDVGLQRIEPGHVDRRRRGRSVVLGVEDVGEDAFLLGQDPVVGQVLDHRVHPHRPPIGPGRPDDVGVEISVQVLDLVGGVLDGAGPVGAVPLRAGWGVVADGGE